MTQEASVFVSVVVPVFNEEKQVHNLDDVSAFFCRFSFAWEIVVVDDGSTDRTLVALKRWESKPELKVISSAPNRGKGYAVKHGMLAARGGNRLFRDIDLSPPVGEFNKVSCLFRSL